MTDKQPPKTKEGWEELRSMSCVALVAAGLRMWNDPNDATSTIPLGRTLMLFPRSWFDFIPGGFEVHVDQ